MTLRDDVIKYVKKKYKSTPEYLWRRYPEYAVFRHEDNRKWFAIIMDVPRERLGLPGDERVDIINVKPEDPFLADMLIQQEGFFKGYHFSKGNWVSILLDGTVPQETIFGLIDDSFAATASAKKKQKMRPPKEWIVPANPKYYDVEHMFDHNKETEWKQGSGIKTGDTVYMYVAAPVSAILYKCKVTETDIPFEFADENLTIKALMKIKLLKRFKPDEFPFDVLKEEYGIFAVRGPRGIPHSLSEALK
jgi:predicted DNA-binding protein (MmcQ/YjbR family)